jgi:hypothetical protein
MSKKIRSLLSAVYIVLLIAVVYAAWDCTLGADNACFSATIKLHPWTFAIGLLAGLAVVGISGVAMSGMKQLHGYGTALIAAMVFLPGVATLLTVIFYVAPWLVSSTEKYAPFWGTGSALLAWVILAIFCLRFTHAKHAIPSSYGEIRHRLTQLESQLKAVCPASDFRSCGPCKIIACSQANKQVQKIYDEFSQSGLPWALARGYINVWNRLHRAEEAMIEIAPQETVIAGALNDVLRLQGSQIDHSEELKDRLQQAIEVIDPYAKRYLQGAAAKASPLVITTPSPLADRFQSKPFSQTLSATGGTPPVYWSLSQSTLPDGLELCADGVLSGTPVKSGRARFNVRATDSASVTTTKAFTLTINPLPFPNLLRLMSLLLTTASATAGSAGASAAGGCPVSKTQARAVIRDVRNEINQFRDGRWNGLIVARNRLIATMTYTGMAAYALLAIAIINGAQPPAIAAASVFFLVGATIGLLNQLRSVSQSDTAVEDYGLSTARLISMPLFCGLAAIGGVALMAMPQIAGSYTAGTQPLAITTPSNLTMGVFDKLYCQRIDATGGTPPYTWSASSGRLPERMELQATGNLIAMLPKKPENAKRAEPVKFTAQVRDSTGSSVEKSFFLNITSAEKTSETKPSSKVEASPPTFVLEHIFNLHENIIGLLMAAVFGLTPGLLFDRLQQQSEKYKADLKSSEVTHVKTQG